MSDKRLIIKGLIAGVIVAVIVYTMLAPLPATRIHNHRPQERKAGKQELLGGAVKAVAIQEGTLTGQENGRNIWELEAQAIEATDKQIIMDRARAVLFRPQLPNLVLIAPRITYLPLQGNWAATGGVKGQAGSELKLKAGRLSYEDKRKAIKGEDGIVLSGNNWKLKGVRIDADAQFEHIVVRDRVRLEYSY